MKLAVLRSAGVSAASAALLADAINAWIIANAGERNFLEVVPLNSDGSTFAALILYTE